MFSQQSLGEQSAFGKADTGVDEGHRQLIGQPFEVVGHVQAVAGQPGGAAPVGARMAVELADHRVQRAQRARASALNAASPAAVTGSGRTRAGVPTNRRQPSLRDRL